MSQNVSEFLAGLAVPLRTVSRWSVLSLFFLTPLVFAPITVEALEMNKQVVMFVCVFLAVGSWLGSMIADRSLQLRGGWLLNVLPLVLVAVWFISTWLSVAGAESWLGYGGQEYTSFLMLLCGVGLFYVLVNIADAQLMRQSILTLLWSSGLASLVALGSFARIVAFNTVGDANALMAWLIPMALIGVGFVWLNVKGRLRVITLLVGLIIFTLLLLFVKSPDKLNFPNVVSITPAASIEIVSQTLQQNIATALFGSGPGSFDLDYARYHAVDINMTPYWRLRFDRAPMFVLTLLATTGILGLMTWLAVGGVVITQAVRRVRHRHESTNLTLTWVLFAGWLAMFILQLLLPMNMALMILFWGLSGLLVAGATEQTHRFEFVANPRLALGLIGGSGILMVVGFLTLASLVSRHAADMAFAKATKLNSEGAAPEILVGQMLLAVERYESNPVYQRNLATAYLAEAGKLLAESHQDGEFSAVEQQQFIGVANAAIAAVQQAVKFGEKDALNVATAGLVYRELMPFIPNAQNAAASMYAQALLLEPNNPAYQTDLGRVYLMVADRAEQVQNLPEIKAETRQAAAENEIEDLRLAVENLETAIRLKPDYAPAHYYLSAAYERQGNLDDASERLAALTKAQPNDVGLGFQLGIIYLKMNKADQAKQELERILTIYPDYSNAMWYLAAIKANQGESEAALELLRSVAELNPGNGVVDESIRNLEAGLATPQMPAPIELNGAEIAQ